MTKEELQIELDKVDRELWQVLDVLYYGNEKIDNLFVIKKIKCGDDTVYESSENNRIYTKCDNALDVFDEKANLIKRIFKKLTEIEYFTQEEKQSIIKDKVNLEELNKRKIILQQKEKEIQSKIDNLQKIEEKLEEIEEKIEEEKCVPKTSVLSKFLEWFKI